MSLDSFSGAKMTLAISRTSSAVMPSTRSFVFLSPVIFPYASRPLPIERHWVSPLSLLMASWPSSCFFAALSFLSDSGFSWILTISFSIVLMHFSRLCLSHHRLIVTIPESEYWVYPHSTPYTHPFFSLST